MRSRTAIGVICGIAALAAAGRALAAGPALSVSATSSSLAGSGSTMIRFTNGGTDPAATIEVYSPPGYALDLFQPFGSTIGDIRAQALSLSGAAVRLAGPVRTANPAEYLSEAAACTPGRLFHDAVWTLSLKGRGLAIDPVNLFVDRSPAGPGSGSPSALLRACLPQPGGGFPIHLESATLTLNGVFENPPTHGEYRWTTIFTTYSGLTTLPVASQTIVRLPPRLTLKRKLIRPHRGRGRTFVRLSGVLTENGRPVSGVRVEILSGPRASSLEHLVFATTFGRGKFTVVAPLRRRKVFKALVSVPIRTGRIAHCDVFSLRADAVCSSLTLAPFSAASRSFTVKPPPRRPPKKRRR